MASKTKGRGECSPRPKKKKRRGFLVCPRLGLSVWFSGHSARAGQTLAKIAIKEKISAVEKVAHRIRS
jgi:hypothetical protein